MLCAVLLVNRAGSMVLPFFSLFLTQARGFSVLDAGRLLGVFGVGAAIGSYLGGWLSDRIGTIRTQQLSLLFSGVGFLWFIRLDGLVEITLAMFLLSIVSEAFRPAVMASIAERAPSNLQVRSFALLRLAANLGMSLGPALGGLLAVYSYSWLFVGDALTCWLALAVLTVALRPEPPPESSAVSAEPLPVRSPWRDGPFLGLMLLMIVLTAVVFQIFSTLPLFLSQEYGYRESVIGFLLGLNALLIVMFEMVLIHWAEDRNKLAMIGLGAFLLCAGLALMPFGSSVVFIGLTVAIWTLGEMLSLPMTNALVAARAGRGNRGRYMGIYTTAFSLAFIVAPIGGTWVMQNFGSTALWLGVGALGCVLWGGALALIPAFRAPAAAAALILVCLTGCAGKRPPVLEPLQALEDRTPVVMIPGITGSRLVNADTGKIVWGRANNFFLPRDDGHAIALPIDAAIAAQDPVRASAALTRIRLLGMVTIHVYDALVRLMEANGYRTGDLDDPRPGDSFFLLDYDWRRGNIEAAQELGRRLERLRRVRGDEVLQVDLICQSNAARLARWFIKYGTATLEQAERGQAVPPDRVTVRKLILVGTANGGAMSTFGDLTRGRTYARVIGRKFQPEVLFTFPSLFEALPTYRKGLFVDEQGRTLEIDLFDPEAWRTYDWSVYSGAAQKRLRKKPAPELFGDAEMRAAFLGHALERSRRLHDLLLADAPGFGGTRYYSVQNVSDPTRERVLLVRDGDTWRTWFSTDRRVRRNPSLFETLSAPGDGLATAASQAWLSPQERAAFAAPTVHVAGAHRRLVLYPEVHRAILEFLLD